MSMKIYSSYVCKSVCRDYVINNLRVADIVSTYELCVFIARHTYVCVSVCLLYNIHL